MFIKSLILISTLSLLAGARIHRTEERIVGGKQISIEYVPWQVAVLNNGRRWCGGSILSESVILTAAHCVIPHEIGKLTVRAGSSDWSSGGQEVAVALIKSHDDFNYGADGTPKDIAVIFLQAPLKMGQNVKSIPLAEKTPDVGAEALVTGWGETGKGNPVQNTRYLRGVNVFIVNHLKCTLALAKEGLVVAQDNLCAAAPGKDACKSDSGGPLVDVNKGQLIGVVSWGKDCADPRYPGIYVDVAFFNDWIRQVVSNSTVWS